MRVSFFIFKSSGIDAEAPCTFLGAGVLFRVYL